MEKAIRNSCTKIGGKSVIITGINLEDGHPTDLGMIQIKDSILKTFDK